MDQLFFLLFYCFELKRFQVLHMHPIQLLLYHHYLKKLNEGLDEKQIYVYLKDKYGDWILYDPGFSKNTYFLWLLPILMFVFGGAIILRKVILKKKKL